MKFEVDSQLFFPQESLEKCTTDILPMGERQHVFAEKICGVTHPDKHVREGSSGVFRNVDRWDDPVSLLSSQPVGSRSPLMFPGELDDFGLGVPDSGQHFCDASLEPNKKELTSTASLSGNNVMMSYSCIADKIL